MEVMFFRITNGNISSVEWKFPQSTIAMDGLMGFCTRVQVMTPQAGLGRGSENLPIFTLVQPILWHCLFSYVSAAITRVNHVVNLMGHCFTHVVNPCLRACAGEGYCSLSVCLCVCVDYGGSIVGCLREDQRLLFL